ncbi:cytochrome P450 [Zopfia rhizophila CBS 207.26]|uniref:Cytochrome P450 n=1 Tax=Zopfia rhizophila CBS 207.26 TaxID=1314779 RepID=A0A6A6E0A0_9PEZI|nr:cytochrome P450 [Zopfia rhizophila CBS 207.26]
MASWTDVLFATCSGLLLYFLVNLYRARASFYRGKVKKGLPMPRWDPIFGHLLVMDETFRKYRLPPDVQRPDIFTAISREFDDKSESAFYLDLWPFINPLLITCSPHHGIQTTQNHELNKPDDLVPFLHPITGGNSFFSINGDEWKHARAIFASGFNTNYILNQTEHIIQEAEVYVDVLKEYATKGDICLLNEVTVRYTMDISGALTLNKRLHAQRGGDALVSAMRNTLDWHFLGELRTPLVRWSPLIRLIAWYNGRKMNHYIAAELDKRFTEWKSGAVSPSANRTAIDLAIADYLSKRKDKAEEDRLDPDFKDWAVVQLRMLFFVAHDSTSATICYIFYLLSKNATALQKLRDEHEQVLGTKLADVPNLLREQPQLLNKLPYTTAVIKETLRIFPPASGFRIGKPGVDLEDDDGSRYPTEDTRVWVLHSRLHNHPKYWKDPEIFTPERWLVGPEDPLYPRRGAWRPFEFGPRNCLGQALSMLDLKVTLCMTARRFDINDAYDEWDKLKGITRVRTFFGERAYQCGNGGGRSAPCGWVSMPD